jgi:hypothetical protein
MLSTCFTEVSHLLALLSWLASRLVDCLQISRCADLWLASDRSLINSLQSSLSTGSAVYVGICLIAQMLQTFVLGPRLILSIREYNAKLVTGTHCRTDMTSIAFQAGGNALTGGDV